MTASRFGCITLGLIVCGSALTGCSSSDGGEASAATRVVAATTTTTEPPSSSFDGFVSVTEKSSAFEDWERASTFDPAETLAVDAPVGGPATTIPAGAGPHPIGYTGFLGNLRLDEVVAPPAGPEPVTAPATAPLTGLPGTVPVRPAVIAKIDNSPGARPQRGLNAADIVFEEQVEGGVTRFAAVFHLQMAVVGPIRSTRTTDISFINAFGGPALLYPGANRIVHAIVMRQETIQNYSAARSSGYWRDSSRRVPHNLFTDSASFVHRCSSPPAQFTYRQPRTSLQTMLTTTTTGSTSSQSTTTTSGSSSTSTTLATTTEPTPQPTSPSTTATPTTIPTTITRPPTLSQPANVLSATLGQTRVRWDWNGLSWMRTQNGTVHKTDGGAQVSAANVVVAAVAEAATGMTDSVGTPVPEFVFVGTGPVSVFSEGRRIDGIWTRSTLPSAVVLTDAFGTVIELSPGRTWVELVVAGTYQSS
ncbi:MAG: DUF3048 domain-containing protein [Actinomycetota bacterium]|nr:DUF3048 domain-containing protein [Actinomycetota bacterium]